MTRRSSREPSRRGRRLSAALVAGGLVSAAVGVLGLVDAPGAQAAAAPGSEFGSIDLSATAYGLRVPFFRHSGEDVESELPYSQSQLSYGGHALTSVMWPGDTGGHGGDTLKLLTGSCLPPNPTNTIPIPIPVPLPDLPCAATVPALPDQVYESLNDPYKAEAQSGTGKSVVKKSNPGVDMVATATNSLVRATSTLAGAKAPAIGDGLGSTLTDTTIKLTGPHMAVVDAVSVMHDISLGGGAVTIQAVRSVAHAVSDGKTASGHATTTIVGMKVGGVPVTVDDHGVHVQGQGERLPSLDALDKLLAKSGFSLVVADPTKHVQGASAQFSSGQLILTQDNAKYAENLNDSTTVVTLGGAAVNAATSPAYVFDDTFVPAPPASAPAQPTSSRPVAPAASGGAPPASTPDLPSPQVAPPSGDDGLPPVLAARRTALPGGLSPGWIVAVILGAGLIAAGLRRLPDQLFTDRGPACTLGGEA